MSHPRIIYQMSRTERFYKIDRMLQPGRSVPLDRLLRELDVSRATFKRDIEHMCRIPDDRRAV